MPTIQQIRREARRPGVPWSAVRAAYREIKATEIAKREHPNEVRQTAWHMMTAHSPGCWPFWRHGFDSRWGHKLGSAGDYTVVPGYDELAQEVGQIFPEYADDTGTERLFDFLFSPYDKLPSRQTMYAQAIELAAADTPTDVPF